MNYIYSSGVSLRIASCTPVTSSPKKGPVASSSAERESNLLFGMLLAECMGVKCITYIIGIQSAN